MGSLSAGTVPGMLKLNADVFKIRVGMKPALARAIRNG